MSPMLIDLPQFWDCEDVHLMSYEQVGVYWALLSHQWQEGSIPRDARRIAVILCRGARLVTVDDLVGAPVEAGLQAPLEAGLQAPLEAGLQAPLEAGLQAPLEAGLEAPLEAGLEAPLEAGLQAPLEAGLQAPLQGSLEAPLEGSLWAALQACFEPHPENDSRLVNPRLHLEREAWRKKHQAYVEAGRKGGRRSSLKRRKTKASGAQAPPEGSLEATLEATLEGRLPQRLEASLDKTRQEKTGQEKTGQDKKRQDKKARASNDELPPEVQALDTLTEEEKRRLARLLKRPSEIDPKGKRAAKRTNAAAMKAERRHLLAWLQVTTAPVVADSDNALELWALWRANRRAKHRLSAERTPWLSEVDALRKLHQADRPPGEILIALSTAAAHAWQGFDWEWVDKDRGIGRRSRPRGVTGAAGHLPPETHEEVAL